MYTIDLPYKQLSNGFGLPQPRYETHRSAGMDLRAAIAEDITIGPGERKLIPTGLVLAIPEGYEGQVRARSGLALKRGLGLPNSPGTIDSDYRGEVCVVLINWSSECQVISRGDRIAQLVIAPVIRALLTEVEDLDQTVRGEGGFGHTGK